MVIPIISEVISYHRLALHQNDNNPNWIKNEAERLPSEISYYVKEFREACAYYSTDSS
jgi:hypothetical protein